MILYITPTDTSFSYRCDWQYAQMQNDVNSLNDLAEHFAAFFMQLDKAVFGHTKFNITDTSLFRTPNGPAGYLLLDSVVSTNTNNFYELVEFCQDVTYFYQACPYTLTACSEGCDQCYLCMESFVITYCWQEYVDIVGGGGGTGGSGGGTGNNGGGSSGSGGGGSTPPNCDQQPEPFAKGSGGQTNVINPCGGVGWVPIDDDLDNSVLNQFYQGLSLLQKYWWNNPVNTIHREKLIVFLHSIPNSYPKFNYLRQLIDWMSIDSTVTPSDLSYFLQVTEAGDGEYDASYWENPTTVFQQIVLPSLQQFFEKFPKRTVGNGIKFMPSSDVYEMVGDPLKSKYGEANYQNACAIRGSWALTQIKVGQTFPFRIPLGTGNTQYGANDLLYIVSAKGFNKYMHKRFGSPSNTIDATQIAGSLTTLNNFFKNLRSQNVHGIYTLITSGGNYTGHVDLMTFGDCLGGYSLPENISLIEKIEIWQLQ